MPKVTTDRDNNKLKLFVEVADIPDINKEHIAKNEAISNWQSQVLAQRLAAYKAGRPV